MSFLCCCLPCAEAPESANRQPVLLDVLHMSVDAVVVKAGRRLCGRGSALANAPLVQNKSFWETTLQAQGKPRGSLSVKITVS
jgi:hypothetical protein